MIIVTEDRSIDDLLSLIGEAVRIEEAAEVVADDIKPNEATNDPHRLARINLQRYAERTNGGTIRYWRDEWYAYKSNRYKKLGGKEFSAKLGSTIKEEFDRANIEAQQRWEEAKQAAEAMGKDFTEKRPVTEKVTTTTVKNVMQATSGMQILSNDVEANSVIDASGRTSASEQRRWISMQNGIVDLDALLADADDPLLPHTPNWFSTICLPYDYNTDADCPRWKAFLNHNLEKDAERIAVLQEWFGYMLIPSTDYQKFLFMEGDGSNGKSVALAAMEAMIGHGNCSHVQLEQFDTPFVITQIIGKLINFSNECSEIETAAEGMIKSIASGDPMTFNRKGIAPIECSPYARLVLSGNARPRFGDKSFGLWRRMIPLPWLVTIADEDKIVGMDKQQWWERSGELPGIFNWAVAGLARLLEQNKFTPSKVITGALDSYRMEMNPTKLFLHSNYIEGPKDSCWVTTSTLFEHYKNWAVENGYRPVSEGTLGKEFAKHFKKAKKSRLKYPDGTRQNAYVGIKPGTPKCELDEIDLSTPHEEETQKEMF